MSHKKRLFCINRVKSQTVFKKFQFPSQHVHNPFSSPPLPLPLPKPPFLLIKPPLSSSIFKKRYRFSLIFNLFQVSSLSFLRFGVYVEIWLLNMGFWCFWWVWYMGFVGFHNIMFFLHVCSSYSCITLWFVLWCAYYVHDKMSLRCFCVYFWTSLSTKIVGIIMFLCFETSIDYVFFTHCPLHVFMP